MKKLLSIAAIFLMGMVMATAQNDKQVNKVMGDLQQACNMTADQAAKVKPMVQSFVNTRVQNRQQNAGDKAALKAANATNRKNFKANLSTVLTDAQIKQYEEYMEQQHDEKKARQSGGESDGSGQ